MLAFALLAFAFPTFGVSSTPLRGVAPPLAARYVPDNTASPPTWKCLTGGRVIAWSAVNDDYCDCLDGSDEPGALGGVPVAGH